MSRPTGVTTIAVLFFAAATYLIVAGSIMLASPGSISMSVGADLLGGLELGGPYMFLLVGAVGAGVGVGLSFLNNWARRVAILLAMIGIVLLIPTVSSSVIALRMGRLAWGGLAVIVRVMIVWYLYQQPVKESFERLRAGV
ncbi:MAG: hypothetical protein ACRD3W_10330, partial [Terriglobales bacterium]